jgi:hypothetical protein
MQKLDLQKEKERESIDTGLKTFLQDNKIKSSAYLSDEKDSLRNSKILPSFFCPLLARFMTH